MLKMFMLVVLVSWMYFAITREYLLDPASPSIDVKSLGQIANAVESQRDQLAIKLISRCSA